MAKFRKYPMMFEPYKLGNGVVLKSRLEAAPSGMHFVQGPEPFPNEAIIDNYSNKAKNGAALVAVQGCSANWRPDKGHGRSWDITDGHNQHYLAQMTDAIHAYNSKAMARTDIDQFIDRRYDVSTGVATAWVVGDGSQPHYDCVEAPADVMLKAADDYANMCLSLKNDMGFDGVWIHGAYRHMFIGRCLSPITNKRADQYGGSVENRFRFPLHVAKLIKEKCGKEFIVEMSISGHDPIGENGNIIEDICEFARMAEGYFDIFQVKAPWIDEAHPIQFHEETPWLYMAEKIKASNPKITIQTVSGCFKPDTCEEILQAGKADMIAMARSFISNPDYGKLVREGRSEDIVPCLRCNKCHKSSMADPWVSVCSVNPIMGIEHRVEKMLTKPQESKKVAVIGGGPAGMKSALVAAERGHKVTLYEKSGELGGQMCVTKSVPFKWTLQELRKYLIAQINKSGVKVVLGTAPEPEELQKENYDVVIAAVGAVAAVPPIPGVNGSNVMTAVDAYSKVDELKAKIVIIGGGEIGVETGIYLAQNGKDVTVLEMRGMLAADSTPVHYYKMFRDAWESCQGFSSIVNATVCAISDEGVTYKDSDGKEQHIEADTVIVAAGMKAKDVEAMSYYKAGGDFYMVGDCRKAGNIQKTMRSAFITASQF